MKFVQQTSIDVLSALLKLNRRLMKIFPLGGVLHQNRHYGVALTGLRVTGLQVRCHVSNVAKPSIY